MKVLVADDNTLSLELLRETLAHAGYEVETANDGVQALEKIQSENLRLVVSDWEMPQLTGPDLCKAIRADDRMGYVYIILVTSHDSPEETVVGLSAGADDFLGKPFFPSELIARVRVGERILSLETRDVAIFAMAKLAESRHPETGAHLERVRDYCCVLARDLASQPGLRRQIDDEFVRLIYLTSPLHDIGKVGIPDHVLLKPGRLDDHERQIMQQHATIGAQTLEAALHSFPGVKFLEMARDIAATHHECWNGRGYPRGFAGEKIPLSGRIVALADVYDALTSKRVYKHAMSHETAKALITKASGEHFDPAVVAAFLRTEREFVKILEKFDVTPAIAA